MNGGKMQYERLILNNEQMMKRHYAVLMNLIRDVVEEQVNLNGSYENWKENSTIDAATTGKRIGCIDCFGNIPDKVVAITNPTKNSTMTYYIHPDCLDHYWNDYVKSKAFGEKK